MASSEDNLIMHRALQLAQRGWGRTSPNPMVGAVIVKDGEDVGEGWHRKAGDAHAEVEALLQAGDDARNATLYVTLEPCSSHGRTPPCTEAVIKAGISRVVIATLDPDDRHRGGAVDRLNEAGIETEVGVCQEKAQILNKAFFCRVQHGRPYVLLKMAMTADGRIATAGGQSQWITGPQARRRVQRLRQWADAIMVGGETVRQDDPQLLVRTPKNWLKQPLRLIASHTGNLGDTPQVLHDDAGETRIISFDSADELSRLLKGLASDGIGAVLVEGGGELAGRLLQLGYVDEIAFFIAPKLLGGSDSRPVIGGASPTSLAEALDLRDTRMQRCGDDFLLTGFLTDVYRYH
jgi:diaminohydroxyphosphoribosylaminopyrimidine deaminase/5-amino-6-(5-phosphoribosylamino)uracil reductase